MSGMDQPGGTTTKNFPPLVKAKQCVDNPPITKNSIGDPGLKALSKQTSQKFGHKCRK